jgi:hypothetical protein
MIYLLNLLLWVRSSLLAPFDLIRVLFLPSSFELSFLSVLLLRRCLRWCAGVIHGLRTFQRCGGANVDLTENKFWYWYAVQWRNSFFELLWDSKDFWKNLVLVWGSVTENRRILAQEEQHAPSTWIMRPGHGISLAMRLGHGLWGSHMR